MKISKEVIYICEKCGRRYNNEDEAIKCEESHFGIVSIESVKYCSKNMGDARYPYSIDVKFTNGSIHTYTNGRYY